jgi:hypothetical protein
LYLYEESLFLNPEKTGVSGFISLTPLPGYTTQVKYSYGSLRKKLQGLSGKAGCPEEAV